MRNTKGNRLRFRKIGLAVLLSVSLCGLLNMAAEGELGATVPPEEQAVLQAAKDYLDAEVRRDLPKVFACLAPSSAYRATMTYAAYLAEAEASSVRIQAYKILRIARIRDNHDPKAFPNVEKFAQVEVDVVVHYRDTDAQTEVNFDFTFIKEGGKWYKG